MVAPDGERIAALEVQFQARGVLIEELRHELKEIRTLVQSINSKLSSITYDQLAVTARIEQTHAIATHVSSVVDRITNDDEKQAYLISVGTKWVIPFLIAVGTLFTTVYQYRATISEFFRKVFG